MHRWSKAVAVAAWCFGSLTVGPAAAQEADSADKTKALAEWVYSYAYPIISMDLTMRQGTNVPNATTRTLRAPYNQFAHARTYPSADERDVVRFNFDTLYSFAYVETAEEPVVLSVPDTAGRYYLLEMLDMWTDVFAVVGKRTTGTDAGDFALVGPDWTGTLPDGLTRIVAPTSAFWILGRTQTNGPADYDNVHKIQDGYKLTPLSAWGTAYTPPAESPVDPSIDDETPPLLQANAMTGPEMFTRLAELMMKYPPHANDYPILFEMRRLGLEPGKPFDPSTLDPEALAAIEAAGKAGPGTLGETIKRIGRVVNGWNILTETAGTYGTSYKQRAAVAYGGLGANLPEDAVYPTAFVDADGQPLNGANKYVPHFDKGATPPADAFWSITMYDDQGFQIPNPIDRYAIGDRDEMKFNADGSLDIYVQADSPGADLESNWLPAPKDAAFQPTMRLYSPRQEVLDGAWAPPPLRKVD
ncbi:MAG: DUF1254 domain-containing protein [Rhodobacteraceae bacterium]|nr:DUF1254 domain-containing protein [Paracoccaceae bacterium]